MAERIQLSRAKGWRMPENTVKVDRSTVWGNPFRGWESIDGELTIDAFAAVDRFGKWIAHPNQSDYCKRAVDVLRGKNLACWCKPGTPCHADVLLKLANGAPA